MRKIAIPIKTDVSELRAALDELLEHAADIPLEIRNELLGDSFEFFSLKSRSAGWTIEISVEPSETLLDLLSAVRTGDFSAVTHGGSPLVVGCKEGSAAVGSLKEQDVGR